MSTLDADMMKSLQRILTRKPFEVKRVTIVPREHPDLPAIAKEFQLADRDRDRLSACLSWPRDPGVSFITRDSEPTNRRSLGFVGVNGTVVVFEKDERCSAEEADCSFVIDGPFLRYVKVVSGEVLHPGVIGWIKEVMEHVVSVCYYDENGEFVDAEIPRQRFNALSDVRENARFRFQIRQEGDLPEYDILPLSADARRVQNLSTYEFLRLSLGGRRLREPGEPSKPADWSDRCERDRYLRELEDKYEGADWGQGSRQ